MWSDVRAAQNALSWTVGDEPQPGVLESWGATVRVILDARRALGPIDPQSPYALMASATTGALRAAGAPPLTDPATDPFAAVRGQLRALTPQLAASENRAWDSRLLAQTSYQLCHHAQVQTTSLEARRWLQAGERAFEASLFHPTAPSDTGAALARWQHALASVPPSSDLPTLERGVLQGHLTILRHSARLLDRVTIDPPEVGDVLRNDIRVMAEQHQTRLLNLTGAPNREASPAEIQAMLGLGRAMRQFTTPNEEPAHEQLRSLLQSGVGDSAIVAQLTTAHPLGQAVGTRLDAAAAHALAEHATIRTIPEPAPTPREVAADAPSPAEHREAPKPRVARGVRLDQETVVQLVRERDLGAAARNADPANPPAALAGIPPQKWPALIAAGDQAVADLVTSVAPLAFKVTSGRGPKGDVREDFNSEVMLDLVKAAHRYQPGTASWAHFAYVSISLDTRRSVDDAGVRLDKKITNEDGVQVPFRPPAAAPLNDEVQPSARNGLIAPTPEDILLSRIEDPRVQAVRDAIEGLEPRQRAAVTLASQGISGSRLGAELGVSESTGHRALRAGLAHLREQLATDVLGDRANDSLSRAQQASHRTPPTTTQRQAPRR